MQALDKDSRSALEKMVKAVRRVSEAAAQPLRTHGKHLGDARDLKNTNSTYGKQEVQHQMPGPNT